MMVFPRLLLAAPRSAVLQSVQAALYGELGGSGRRGERPISDPRKRRGLEGALAVVQTFS